MTLFQSINQSNHQPNSRPSSFFRLRRSVESVPFVRLSRRPLRSGSLRTFLCSFRRDLYRRTHARTRRTKISAALVNECEPSARTSKPVPTNSTKKLVSSVARAPDRSIDRNRSKNRNIETPKPKNRNRKTETEKPKPIETEIIIGFFTRSKRREIAPDEQTREKSQSHPLAESHPSLSLLFVSWVGRSSTPTYIDEL